MNVIALNNVCLTRQHKPILQDINWEVKHGEHWAILGRNGSGKTMLTNIVAGYLWPTTGTVEVLGKTLGRTDIRELRKHIGWVSNDLQNNIKETDSLIDIVVSGYYSSIGLYETADKNQYAYAEQLLSDLGLSESINTHYGHLSYGQKRRVLIARSLINKPALLILDEPCTGLDIRTKQEYLQWIENLIETANNLSVVMITHHIDEIVPGIENILYLKEGTIQAQGTKEAMLTKDHIQNVLDIEVEVQKNNNYYKLI